MKMKVSTKPFHLAVAKGKVKNMTDVQDNSGLAYVTVFKITRGMFTGVALQCIIKYLLGCGFSQEEILQMKMDDVFEISD